VGGPLVAKDDLLPQCHVDSVWEFQHANV
jgi:hypothetical protein